MDENVTEFPDNVIRYSALRQFQKKVTERCAALLRIAIPLQHREMVREGSMTPGR